MLEIQCHLCSTGDLWDQTSHCRGQGFAGRVDGTLRTGARKCFMFTGKFCWVFFISSMPEVRGRGAAGDGYTWVRGDSEQNIPSVCELPGLLPCQSGCHTGTLAHLRNGGHRNHISKADPENHMAQAPPGGSVSTNLLDYQVCQGFIFSLGCALCLPSFLRAPSSPGLCHPRPQGHGTAPSPH